MGGYARQFMADLPNMERLPGFVCVMGHTTQSPLGKSFFDPGQIKHMCENPRLQGRKHENRPWNTGPVLMERGTENASVWLTS